MALNTTKNIQKKLYRRGELNEVIGWAIDINKCEGDAKFTPISTESRTKERLEAEKAYTTRIEKANLFFRYQSVDTRSEYVKAIASSFRSALQSAVEETARLLGEHLDYTSQSLKKEISDEEYEEHMLLLWESAKAVVKIAVEIRSEDKDG